MFNHLNAIPDYETISEVSIFHPITGEWMGVQKVRVQDFIHRSDLRYEQDAGTPTNKTIEPYWRGGK